MKTKEISTCSSTPLKVSFLVYILACWNRDAFKSRFFNFSLVPVILMTFLVSHKTNQYSLFGAVSEFTRRFREGNMQHCIRRKIRVMTSVLKISFFSANIRRSLGTVVFSIIRASFSDVVSGLQTILDNLYFLRGILLGQEYPSVLALSGSCTPKARFCPINWCNLQLELASP